MPSVRNFETWAPLLAVMWAIDPDGLASPGTYVAGHVDARQGWGYTWTAQLDQRLANMVRALAARAGIDPVGLVRDALKEAAMARISFVVNFFGGGRVVLHLLDFGPAVEVTASGVELGSLVLVEGALPELWRRQPTPSPRARPAASADPELLERTLRERLPGAIGAAETEIADAEARLGISFPQELKVLYRVTRAHREDRHELAERVFAAVGCYPLPLDELFIATAATRPLPWIYAAQEAAYTSPSGAVQALVGSPGWLVFGSNGGGDWVAIDLTPGPRGNTGQVIMIWHDEPYGAGLFARSLTDLAMGKRKLRDGSRRGEPLADPLQVTGLPGLEYLELGPQEWRALLDAGAVPPGLLAAAVEPDGGRDPIQLVAIANELLALWDRPRIAQTILEGNLRIATPTRGE